MRQGRPITEDDLQAYVDGALDGHRRAEVESFLAAHSDFADRVAADMKVRDELRARLVPIASEPVPSELNVARLIESRRFSPAVRTAPWQLVAALALMFLGGAGGWALRSGQEPPRAGIASLAQEAADTYAVYAPDGSRPVEIKAEDSSELVRWGSQRLERPLAIPDLSSSGFKFLGGRVVPTPHGPAVLYIFDNGSGTRLALLTRNMAVDRNTPMSARSLGAGTSVSWSRRGLGFSLVGPLDEDALHSIADSARQQLDRTT